MTDLDIAKSVQPKQIAEIAKKVNIPFDDLELYGKYKAKLPHTLIDEKSEQKQPCSCECCIANTSR